MVALLELLRSTHLDAAQTHMDEVMLMCTAEALAGLSAASHWHREHCRRRLHEKRLSMEQDLATRLGYSYHEQPEPWQFLSNVRALTIPDTLPHTLRPLLGKWLRATGRLGQVNCVRCRSWTRTGEVVGWIDLESVRAGRPQHLSPEERFALEWLDTTDGLLKTVLEHVCIPYSQQGEKS